MASRSQEDDPMATYPDRLGDHHTMERLVYALGRDGWDVGIVAGNEGELWFVNITNRVEQGLEFSGEARSPLEALRRAWPEEPAPAYEPIPDWHQITPNRHMDVLIDRGYMIHFEPYSGENNPADKYRVEVSFIPNFHGLTAEGMTAIAALRQVWAAVQRHHEGEYGMQE